MVIVSSCIMLNPSSIIKGGIKMFEDKVRAILGARAFLDNNDPRIEQRWEELIILLSGDAN